MFCFPNLINQFFLIILYGRVLGSITSASQSPPGGLQSLSSATSARAPSEQTYQRSDTLASLTTLQPSDTVKDTGDPGKVCVVGDCANDPSATKTVDQYGSVGVPNLEKLCVLWNSSCTGDVNSARNEFFSNTSEALRSNECFQKQPTGLSEPNSLESCYDIESSQELLQFGQAKAWMRSSKCRSDQAVWASSMPDHAVDKKYLPNGDPGAAYCCAKCGIKVENVDIYYWPEVDVDTSCLDIIGTRTNPVDYGATTTSNEYALIGRFSSTLSFSTYWGCIGQDSSVTTTAYITHIKSLMVKASSYNPWSPPPCPEATLPATTSNRSIEVRGRYASIHARAQSLIIQPSITQNDGLPVSTVVLGNFTFTSPSIYANLHSIIGNDDCGDPVIIPTTMLTFSPGELSTIAGPLTDCGVDSHCSFSTKPYDFQDLPCPPQSVMEENWYKPQPGEPYRPLIAMPKQILQMNPLFEHCTDNLFTGYDPPRTLVRATALAPTTTTKDYAALTIAPKPSPTPDAGARKTPTGKNTPIHTPAMEQPALEFKDEGPNPENEASHFIPLESSPTPSPVDPEVDSSNPQQGNNAKGAPEEETSPNPPVKPMPTIAVGVVVGGSDQNTGPAASSIPAQANNVETVGGEPREGSDQVQSFDPTQTNIADATIGDPGKENPSNDDTSKDADIVPETNEDPTQATDPVNPDKPSSPPPSNPVPFNSNPFLALPNRVFGIAPPPSQPPYSNPATILPSTKPNPTRATNPTKPSSPDSNPVPVNSNPFPASPNELYAIEDAPPLRSHHSVLPNAAQTKDGVRIPQTSPARVELINPSTQLEPFSSPVTSQIPDLQTVVTAQAITPTPTIAAAGSDTSGAAISPFPSPSMDLALNRVSGLVNATRMSAVSVEASGVGRVGGAPTITMTSTSTPTPTPATTATGSNTEASNTGLLSVVAISQWLVRV